MALNKTVKRYGAIHLRSTQNWLQVLYHVRHLVFEQQYLILDPWKRALAHAKHFVTQVHKILL